MLPACLPACLLMLCCVPMQNKKRAEEERQRDVASLFAMTIKQPKVPPGETSVVNEMQ